MDVIPHSHLGTPDNPSPAAHDAVAVWAADEAAQFGHDDLAFRCALSARLSLLGLG